MVGAMAMKEVKSTIPVATRVDAEVAYELAKQAQKFGMTLSSYVAMVLGRIGREMTAEDELRREREHSRLVVGKFIIQIAKSADERMKLTETFKKIDADERAGKDILGA